MNYLKKIINSNRHFLWILFIFLLSTSCKQFERNNPSQTGTYYPNHTVAFRATPDQWDKSVSCLIIFSQPAEIKAVGKMARNRGDVALITPIVEQRSSCEWAKNAKNFYVEIWRLEATGRIEYSGYKTSSEYFWESGLGTLCKLLVLGIIAFVAYLIINKINIDNERKRILEEKQKEEDERRKIREIEMKEEIEIERRKNIVADISKNLYHQTLKEVNKTSSISLSNELFDISSMLHSESMNEIITNSNTSDFQNAINSINIALDRLLKLALKEQGKI